MLITLLGLWQRPQPDVGPPCRSLVLSSSKCMEGTTQYHNIYTKTQNTLFLWEAMNIRLNRLQYWNFKSWRNWHHIFAGFESLSLFSSNLESGFASRALWWTSGTGLHQNKLLAGDGGDGLSGTADFSKWGVVIHGWLLKSEAAGESRVRFLPVPLLTAQLCSRSAWKH